jgi:ribosomal protein L35AE/L33A
VPALIGAIFVTVGVVVTVPLLWMALEMGPEVAVAGIAGPIFAVVGGILLAVGIRRARRQLHALRDGVAVRGEIVDLHRDTSESINGRHPWAVVYAYEAGGRMRTGTVKSWGRAGAVTAHYAVGSPVHVLYVRERPERSALYPPIR